MTTITQKLAAFVADTTYARLPPEATDVARRTLLDTVGVALAGRRESAADIISDVDSSTPKGDNMKFKARLAAAAAMLSMNLVAQAQAQTGPIRFGWRLLPARLVALATLAATALLCSGGAAAQGAWPTKPVTVISPFATGGSVDVLTRLVVTHMSQTLGQPIVISTLAGAGGTIGAARTAQSAPDGYTLVAGSSGSNAAAYSVYEKLPYKADDFAQIGLMAIIPALIVVKKDLPVKSLQELVAFAKANPGKVSFGHPGVGSSVHLQCELFKQVANIDITMVPYRGAGPLMADLMGGQIDGACDAPPSSTGPHQAGQIRAIAVLGDQRASSMPDVLTTAEQQMPTLQGAAWVALFAPRGTPAPLIDRLSRALSMALESPEVQQRMAKLGTDVPTPGQRGSKYADEFVRSEIAKWETVARGARIPKQ